MAQKVSVEVTCDMDHATGVGKNRKPVEVEAAGTYTVSVDGRTVDIDLCAKDAADLQEAFAPYLSHGRKPERHRGPARHTRRPAGAREHSQDVRSWAKAQGIEVNARGRVPTSLTQQYEAAHAAGNGAGNGVPAAQFNHA